MFPKKYEIWVLYALKKCQFGWRKWWLLSKLKGSLFSGNPTWIFHTKNCAFHKNLTSKIKTGLASCKMCKRCLIIFWYQPCCLFFNAKSWPILASVSDPWSSSEFTSQLFLAGLHLSRITESGGFKYLFDFPNFMKIPYDTCVFSEGYHQRLLEKIVHRKQWDLTGAVLPETRRFRGCQRRPLDPGCSSHGIS